MSEKYLQIQVPMDTELYTWLTDRRTESGVVKGRLVAQLLRKEMEREKAAQKSQ